MKKLTVVALIIIIAICATGCTSQKGLIIVDDESGVYDFIADKDYGEIIIYQAFMAIDADDPDYDAFMDKSKWFEHTLEVKNISYPHSNTNSVYKGDKIRFSASSTICIISIKIVSKDDESIYYEYKFKGEPEGVKPIKLPQSSN